jgi:hypothetical protein
MEPKKYATAAAFRRALEDRLQDIGGKEGVDLQRLRRQVAFDRLLARLFQAGQPRGLPWVLKGGYAMELRIKAARTTKDIDLTMRSVVASDEKKDDKKNLAVLEKLQEAAAFSSDDFFVYTISVPERSCSQPLDCLTAKGRSPIGPIATSFRGYILPS